MSNQENKLGHYPTGRGCTKSRYHFFAPRSKVGTKIAASCFIES